MSLCLALSVKVERKGLVYGDLSYTIQHWTSGPLTPQSYFSRKGPTYPHKVRADDVPFSLGSTRH